jgi:GNAT superfamily N-acetyltransferase
MRCAGFDAVTVAPGTDVPSQPPSAPTDLVIRTAVRDDVGVVLSFIRQLAEYEQLASEVEATEDALEATLFGDHPAAEVIIASLGDRDVGFALFFGTYSTFLARPCMHLEDLFVVPDARGRGIGHALLTRVAAIAAARGCGRLQWNVLSWNAPALAFYRRLGAFSLDDWQTFRLNREGLQALGGGSAPTPTS